MFPHLKIPKNFACGALQKASPVCILLFKFEKLWINKIVRVRIARTERINMISGYSVGRRFPRSVPVCLGRVVLYFILKCDRRDANLMLVG